MSECKSCVGCKFLFGDGTGYSNYTWENTTVRCALGQIDFDAVGKSLGVKGYWGSHAEEPCDWNHDPQNDNWPVTANSRCDKYSPGEYIVLDPDRDGQPSSWTTGRYNFTDEEQYLAIAAADNWDKVPPFLEYMERGR